MNIAAPSPRARPPPLMSAARLQGDLSAGAKQFPVELLFIHARNFPKCQARNFPCVAPAGEAGRESPSTEALPQVQLLGPPAQVPLPSWQRQAAQSSIFNDSVQPLNISVWPWGRGEPSTLLWSANNRLPWPNVWGCHRG